MDSYEKQLCSLTARVMDLAAFDWDTTYGSPNLSIDTQHNALSFLSLLKENGKKLPTFINYDSSGGLDFGFEKEYRVAVTLQDNIMFVVRDPAAGKEYFLGDVFFNGRRIPKKVNAMIPNKDANA